MSAVIHCADAISDSLSQLRAITLLQNESFGNVTIKQLREIHDNSVDAVETILSCSAHQKRIVDDLLTLSKLDSKLLQINVSATKAAALLKDLDKMFEAEVKQADIVWSAEADASLEASGVDWVLLDRGRTNQIVINLITNAIKFTKNRDTRKVTIRIGASSTRPSDSDLGVTFNTAHTISDGIGEASEDDFYLWFTVQDTGRGMSDEEKEKIFNRFTQGSKRTYADYGGSGLGLFISRELAELQGGEIGVASELGVGSTFGFFIKMRRTAPVKTPQEAPFSKPKLQPNGTEISHAAQIDRQVSVLVCEDNLVNQKVMQKQLSRHGYKVYVADNGQQALDFLQTTSRWKEQSSSEHSVHVILMDVEMPVMNGLVCTEKIREHQQNGNIVNHIPIIAVSANARAEQNDQAVAAGMDDAIAKPFRIADLMPKINRWVDWQSLATIKSH